MDDVFQLVFVLIVLIGWVLKTIADQRQRAQRPPRETAPEGETAGSPRVPPPLPRPRVPDPGRPAARPPAAPPARTGPLPAESGIETGPLPEVVSGITGLALGDIGHLLGAEAVAAAHLRRRADALRVLTAGRDAEPGRALARAGVLWSEVLGPPRALRGPPLAPGLRRLRRRG